MKKILLASSIVSLIALSGCQQLEKAGQAVRQEGEKAINNLSQQAETTKTSILETKAKFDEKSQQVMTAVDAVNKLSK